MKHISKRKRVSKIAVIRIVSFLICFIVVILLLGFNLIISLVDLYKLNLEKKNLESELILLDDKKDDLESDVERLSDPLYVAKYAREKYFYSKEDEIIIRIVDDE